MSEVLIEAARALANSKRGVAVTGAGASVESGLSDFRSPDGLWARYDPTEYATYEAFLDDPDKVWEMWYELGEQLTRVQPNAGHHALAELERLGHIVAIITQNIDNLHFAAGSLNVIEYHGNAHWIVCPACRPPPRDASEPSGAGRTEMRVRRLYETGRGALWGTDSS